MRNVGVVIASDNDYRENILNYKAVITTRGFL